MEEAATTDTAQPAEAPAPTDSAQPAAAPPTATDAGAASEAPPVDSPPAESTVDVLPDPGTPTDTATAEDKMPIAELARLESDNTVLYFGILPIVAIGVLGLIGMAMHYVRKSKNWNELGEAMRIDDGDKPIGQSGFTGFSTRDIAELDTTKPSQRISQITRQPD